MRTSWAWTRSIAWGMTDMKKHLLIAKDRYGEDIWLSARKAWRAVLQGVSGSGKTVLLQVLLAEIAQCGADHQVLIFNPKIVGFAQFEGRFDVVKDRDKFIPSLRKCVDLMMERYRWMEEHGVDELPVSEEFPLLYIVIDEVAEALNPSGAREQAELKDLVLKLASLSRQANMSLLLAGQTISTEFVPSSIRNNLDFQLVMRCASVIQTNFVVPDGFIEEAPAHQLPTGRPGLGYFRTSSTNGHFKLGKALYCKGDIIRRVCDRYKGDYRSVDWIGEPDDKDGEHETSSKAKSARDSFKRRRAQKGQPVD